jgi:RNA polymerase sigma-70 factor (ECF subfamily)
MEPARDESDESALFRRAAGGDDEAFIALALHHRADLHRLAFRFTRDVHAAEDLVQETLVRAHRRIGSFKQDAPFGHWLRRIATRQCLDYLRKRKRRISETSLDATVSEPAVAGGENARDAAEHLAYLMSHLKPEDRLVITLLEIEQWPVREIASQLGWSESKVKVRAFRARAQLKQIHQQKV